MNGTQKVGIFLISLTTASISLLAAGFLGSIEFLPVVIALIPISLGRLVFGKQVLEFAGAIYGVTIIVLGITQLPILIYPEIYGEFYLSIYTFLFGSVEGTVLGNLDAALSYEPMLACLALFVIIYAYKERYIAKIYRKF